MDSEAETARLTTARRALVVATEKVTDAEANRREALSADDDAAAARIDKRLVELRLAQLRAADKVTLLEASLRAEQERARERDNPFPQDLGLAEKNLAAAEQQLRDLRARPDKRKQLDAIHVLECRLPAMRNHVAWLRRIAA